MKKKIISLVLAGVMIISLAGCGKSDSGNKLTSSSSDPEIGNEGKVTTEGNSSGIVGENEGEVISEDISYPLDTDDSFTYFATNVASLHSDYTSYKESPWHTGLAKKTGVDVEWQFPTLGSDATTALNLLLADESARPEAFDQRKVDMGTVAEWANDGVIRDLTEYLPKYAPDFWEYINAPENATVKKSVVDDNGRFYFIPSVRESSYNITYMGPIVRKDWLEECNLEMPVTLEDWEKVLVAFKEKYGAGFISAVSYMKAAGLASGTGAMGLLGANLYVDDNGKIQCANTQPEWKACMEYLKKWYDMGLIDPDFFSADDTIIRDKALNGKTGLLISKMSQISFFIQDAEAADNGAEWVGLDYPRTAAGEPTSMIQTAASVYDNAANFFITDKCPEELIPTILKWVNYAWTEEGKMYYNFGVEGETYTINENGKPVFTNLLTDDPLGLRNAVTRYTAWGGSALGIQMVDYVKAINNEVAGEAVDKWISNTVAMQHCVPPLSLTEDEQIVYTDNWNACSTYIGEMALKFITGDESLGDFESYIKKLQGMGLDEVLKVQQAAYDRFISK